MHLHMHTTRLLDRCIKNMYLRTKKILVAIEDYSVGFYFLKI